MQFKGAELLSVAVAGAAAAAYIDDSLGALAIIALWLSVKLTWTDDRIPVLPAAVMYQWMQVTIGLFYSAATGHTLTAQQTDYRAMVVVGLVWVVALAAGLRLGIYLIRDERENREERPVRFLSMPVLLAVYVGSIASEATILEMTAQYPSLRQILITLTVMRLGLLFLVLRRFCQPVIRPLYVIVILVGEVVLGLTGYFAGFKDPLIISAIVLAEVFDVRNKSHWLAAAGVTVLGAVLAIMWMGVRSEYRRQIDERDPLLNTKSGRVNRVNALATEFFSSERSQLRDTADQLIDRMWAIYYPALALGRVPTVQPHTNGALIRAALVHIVTPRVFFPDKPDLPSDSDMVRRYAGVYVAGAERNTSIAFGYSAEAYIDFGIPMMFVPIFVFGVAMGAVYGWFLRTIWHRELAVAVVIVVFWLSLYLFERSWANVLGTSVAMIVYLGLPVTILDRFLVVRQRQQDAQRELGPVAFGLESGRP
jgi:hypothetical protein